mmetsp:Transcript_39000/g.110183  ORF Transcript_39000/g.110183 Transcript_39000/m.110183 type:complete len:103 (-) Transcript_39000:104-412(-)
MASFSVLVRRSTGEKLLGPEAMAGTTTVGEVIAKLPVEANPWKLSLGSVAAVATQKLDDLAGGGEVELTASSAPAWEEAKLPAEGLHDASLKNARHPPFGGI